MVRESDNRIYAKIVELTRAGERVTLRDLVGSELASSTSQAHAAVRRLEAENLVRIDEEGHVSLPYEVETPSEGPLAAVWRFFRRD